MPDIFSVRSEHAGTDLSGYFLVITCQQQVAVQYPPTRAHLLTISFTVSQSCFLYSASGVDRIEIDLAGKSRRNGGHSAGHCDGGTLTSQYGNFSAKFLSRFRRVVEALMFSSVVVHVAACVEILMFVDIAWLVCISASP